MAIHSFSQLFLIEMQQQFDVWAPAPMDVIADVNPFFFFSIKKAVKVKNT